MLVAGGGLRSAVLLLRKVGMPDCAQALAQAVAEAQLDSKQGSADAGAVHICISTMQLRRPDVDACLAKSVLHADQGLMLQGITSCKLKLCQRLCLAMHAQRCPSTSSTRSDLVETTFFAMLWVAKASSIAFST